MKIDFHSHFFPASYFKALKRRGHDTLELVGIPLNVDVWTTIDERIAIMQENGVDVNVLSLVGQGVYFPDDQFSLDLAQSTNDFLADICQQRPDRFYGLASVPLTDVSLAIGELHRIVGKPGIVGLNIGTNVNGKALDSEEFYPFYEEVDRLGLPLYLHPTVPVRMSQTQEYILRTQVGFPFETTLAAARLAYTGTLERFPNMKIVLCHLGGAIPYLIGRLDFSFNKHPGCRVKISRPPSYYFKRMYYDTAICYTNGQLMCALEAIGEDQLVLGTDLPLTKGRIAPSLDLLASASLSDNIKEKIYEGNAKRLMGLPA